MDYEHDLGPLELNISGCMNACGHHHVGNIGILGVDKKGEEFYQVCIGGSQAGNPQVAKILGPSFGRDALPDVVEKLLQCFIGLREESESFLDVVERAGIEPFKKAVYEHA